MYGDGTAVSQMAAIGSLRAWQEANPDKALFPKTIYENILRQMICLYYPELAGETPDSWMEKSGSLTGGKLAKAKSSIKNRKAAALNNCLIPLGS